MRARVVLVSLVVVALAAGGGWWLTHRGHPAFATALATLPPQTLRAAYTDWGRVAGVADPTDITLFAEEAYERGLSRASALESNAESLERSYGLDLRDARWEVYGQSAEGSVAVLRVGDDTSFDGLRATLRSLGYGEPPSARSAWTGDADITTAVDPALTPVMENVLLLEDEHLVVLSDSASYAEQVDGSDALLDRVSGLVDRVEEPVSAILWADDYACEDLAMTTADDADQARADALVDEAGGVSPLAGLAMSTDPAGDVTVAMEFEDGDRADANLQPRTDLASGESPGLGGAFPDRFTVTSARADDRFVVLELEPAPEQEALLSVISDGPVLFATC